MGTPEIPFPDNRFEGLTPPTPDVREAEPGPDNPPWGVLEAIGFLVMSFVFMVVTQTAFLIAYLLYRGIRLAAVAEAVTKDPVAIFWAVVSIIPAHLLTLGLAWVIVTRLGKRPFLRTLGWDWGRGFNFWRSAGLAVGLLLVGVGVIQLVGNPKTELDRLIESSRETALATAFLATVTAPFVEEVIYRGILYSALQRAAGKGAAVLIVVLIFTGIHVLQYWPNFGVLGTILLLSVVLTLIRAHTGRLLPCVVVHLVFNGIQSLLIVLDPYVKQFTPETPPPVPAPVPAPGALLHTLLQLFLSHL